MASNRAQHLATARNLSISSPAAAAAAESRQPSAIQKPRGPADGRRWLCIAACADRTRSYLAGPVVASSERRQHRASSGPQALRARTLWLRSPRAAVNPTWRGDPRWSMGPVSHSPAPFAVPQSPHWPAVQEHGNVARCAATGARCRR